MLRILVDRRRSLGEDHTQMISQLLLELIPGGAKKDLSAAQAGGRDVQHVVHLTVPRARKSVPDALAGGCVEGRDDDLVTWLERGSCPPGVRTGGKSDEAVFSQQR